MLAASEKLSYEGALTKVEIPKASKHGKKKPKPKPKRLAPARGETK